MASILIIYSTTDGHTRKICQRLRQIIEQHGHQVMLLSVEDTMNTSLTAFDKIIIGASIRYGKHSRKVYDLISRNRQILKDKPSGFFSVSLVARKPEKCRPDTNPYVQKFLKQIAWQPGVLAVFAGKIDYKLYHFWDRQIIRLIMLLTHGPTHPDTAIEYTDWNQVEEFAKVVSNM